MVYADYTASGRSLSFIEDAIRDRVLPMYANTHTEASATGRHTTALREAARRDDPPRGERRRRGRRRVLRLGQRPGRSTSSSACSARPRTAAGRVRRPVRAPLERAAVARVGRRRRHDPRPTPTAASTSTTSSTSCAATRDRPLKVGSFSAASNVTGIITDVEAVSRCAAPARRALVLGLRRGRPVPADRHGAARTPCSCRPHKFPGGPGRPACWWPSARCSATRVPSVPAGGTIVFVSPTGQSYHPDPEIREEGGTPGIVESIRAGHGVRAQGAGRRRRDRPPRALTGAPGARVVGREPEHRAPRQPRARPARDRHVRPPPSGAGCCTATSWSRC